MTLAKIREIIVEALEQEAQSGDMERALHARLPQLRKKLLLPEDRPVAALMTFITSYIRSVPAGLRLVAAVSKRQGFYEYAAPFLELAQDYFLQPPDELPAASALEALLDEAFLASAPDLEAVFYAAGSVRGAEDRPSLPPLGKAPRASTFEPP